MTSIINWIAFVCCMISCALATSEFPAPFFVVMFWVNAVIGMVNLVIALAIIGRNHGQRS